MNTVKTLLILIGMISSVVCHAGSAFPPASIGVSPSRVELAVQKERTTGSATVMNFTDKPVHVAASLTGFDLDESNNFRELAPTVGSLPRAMMLNPADFTIPPNGSQTVRFAIMPERLEGSGEHRAMLFFSELVESNHAAVKINFRLGIPIYAQLGEADRTAQIHDLKIANDRTRLELDISALGNRQVRPTGYYLWWPAGEFPGERVAYRKLKSLASGGDPSLPSDVVGGKLVTKPVFPGARREVAAKLTIPEGVGDYVIAVHVDAGDQSLQRTIRSVPPQS
jgi:P pilus assembly chaperone PapD